MSSHDRRYYDSSAYHRSREREYQPPAYRPSAYNPPYYDRYYDRSRARSRSPQRYDYAASQRYEYASKPADYRGYSSPNKPAEQHKSQSIYQTNNQSVHRSNYQTNNQYQSNLQSSNQSVYNRPIGPSFYAEQHQSINQSIDQSIKQSSSLAMNEFTSPSTPDSDFSTVTEPLEQPAEPTINQANVLTIKDQFFSLRTTAAERSLFNQTSSKTVEQPSSEWSNVFLSLYYAGEEMLEPIKQSIEESIIEPSSASANNLDNESIDQSESNNQSTIQPRYYLSQVLQLMLSSASLARSINQLMDQSSSKSSYQSNKQSISNMLKSVSSVSTDSLLKMISQPFNQSIHAPFYDYVSQSFAQSINQSINQSIHQAITQEQKMNPLYHLWKLFNYSIDRSTNQATEYSSNQSNKQSISLPSSLTLSTKQPISPSHEQSVDESVCSRLSQFTQSINHTIPSPRLIRLIIAFIDRSIVCGDKRGYWGYVLNQAVKQANDQSTDREEDQLIETLDQSVISVDDLSSLAEGDELFHPVINVQSITHSINEAKAQPKEESTEEPVELEEGEIVEEKPSEQPVAELTDVSKLAVVQWLQTNQQSIKDRGLLLDCSADCPDDWLMIDRCVAAANPKFLFLFVHQSTDQSPDQSVEQMISQSVKLPSTHWTTLSDLPPVPSWPNRKTHFYAWKRIG